MFDEILGLPAHPLIVHAAVIAVPALAVLAAVYGLAPRTRPALGWAVAGLAVVAPIAAFAAKESGESLEHRNFASATGMLARRIAEHEEFADPLLIAALALGVLSLVLLHLVRRGRDSGEGGGGGRAVTTSAAVLTAVVAVVAGYYAVRAGHSGAVAVWGG
ncbi:hypothetical protein GCM10027187_54280 [Streptosporangium sandarakinum]|uniref:Small-conductance mechanosensitive channel n=1 Tax=Streptosporangium sandarakinum TaxID=1260955 RepID=A0A852V8Y1_9ACTN|nr:DUF2231 domain-containing protein [Streptosporangium sandarakinum]NYF43998.1 small-conductance mechanosensitive channel [Streptosporangium sandarakinum]